MKKTFTLIIFISIVLSSCTKKECVDDSKCTEQPPTGTTCTAYWESWIYDSAKNKCEYIVYSGCSPIGFDSKAECDICDCKD